MPFKIRDLVIHLLPSDLRLPGLGAECDAGSEVPPGAPPAPDPPGPDAQFLDPRELVELRVMLQIALAQLGGPVSEGELRPQAIEDLDEIEKRLTGALEDVRSQRARFSGKA
jgi:hypothetical protein